MICKKDRYTSQRRAVGGGVGELEFRHKFTPEDLFGKCRLCAEITLQPGQSIGMHRHEQEAEIFYLLRGELVSVCEDASEEPFCTGDMMVTGGGASHSLRNDSSAPATLLAIIVN